MKPWHARANARRSALRHARRTLLSPHTSPQAKDRAVEELLRHVHGPNAWRSLEACKAILDSYYLRDWLPELRVSRAKIEADERRARRRTKRPPLRKQAAVGSVARDDA